MKIFRNINDGRLYIIKRINSQTHLSAPYYVALPYKWNGKYLNRVKLENFIEVYISNKVI